TWNRFVIELSWTDVANNESGWYVERSSDTSSWVQIADISPTPSPLATYRDQSFTGSANFYYRIRPYNGSGVGPYSEVATANLGTLIILSGTAKDSLYLRL